MYKKIANLFVDCLVMAVILAGCEKGELVVSISPKEKTEMVESYGKIDQKASEILSEDGTVEDFEILIPQIRFYPMVEKAWVEGKSLFVKFIKGGIVSWTLTSDEIIPPYIERNSLHMSKSLSRLKAGSLNMPSNNKVCLINQQYGDEGRPYCKEIISALQTAFQESEFDVTIKNGDEANINFFKNLDEYGTVFCINHGCSDGENTWLCTGQEGTMEEIYEDAELYVLWYKNELSIGRVKEDRGGWFKESVPFYTISNKFFETHYEDNSFPNSLIYWVACQAMKSDVLGETLAKKGAGVVIGWDETNCAGQSTGNLLFRALLGGYSVQEAFNVLPEEAKDDDCEVANGAHLVYHPYNAGNMYLVGNNNEEVSITVTNPVQGQTYSERVIQLSGYVTGFSAIGIVEINGISTTLTHSGTSFSQPFLINQGENNIKINCYGTTPNGTPVFVSTELTIYGDFPPIPLFTELRWNTAKSDVDFHLLPPNSTISDLWSRKDCFYYNKTTSWGSYLDVDDIEGFGPEHITIPNTPENGIYTLYVHYYDDDGVGISDAWVDVSANTNELVHFGPYRLVNSGGNNGGDLYAVCTIEYPSATITPLNQYYDLNNSTYNRVLENFKRAKAHKGVNEQHP